MKAIKILSFKITSKQNILNKLLLQNLGLNYHTTFHRDIMSCHLIFQQLSRKTWKFYRKKFNYKGKFNI